MRLQIYFRFLATAYLRLLLSITLTVLISSSNCLMLAKPASLCDRFGAARALRPDANILCEQGARPEFLAARAHSYTWFSKVIASSVQCGTKSRTFMFTFNNGP